MEVRKTSLVYDKTFKMVFDREDERSRKALAGLLGAIIGKEIESIQNANKENKDLYENEKDTIQDIVVKFNDGQYANIEMQLVKDLYVEDRLCYYEAKLVIAQPLKGKTYELKPVYEIMLLDDILYEEDDELYHHFIHRSQHHEISKMNIIIVEMAKVNEDNYMKSELNKWIYYLRNCQNESKRDIIESIKRESETVCMADNIYNEISKEEWDYIYETWKNKPEIDMKFALGAAERRGREAGLAEGIAQGKAEGIAQGKAEGIAQGKAEGEIKNQEKLVQRALQRGRSIEFIMDEYGVSEEFILSIQKSK